MNKNIKNRLHSFILLPLLFTNIVPVDQVINKPETNETIETKSINLNFDILNNFLGNDGQNIKIIDDRGAKVDAYFAQWDLPLAGYGNKMVATADKYGIDWRLLPALAMLETTGGKNLCRKGENFNAFGYGSCKIHFNTFEEAFDAVAKTLSGNGEKTAHLYKDKNIDEILEVYNPKATPGITRNYHGKAKKIMTDIENMEVESSHLAKA